MQQQPSSYSPPSYVVTAGYGGRKEKVRMMDMTCAQVVEIMRNRYGEHNVGADSHCVEEIVSNPDGGGVAVLIELRRMDAQERVSTARGAVRFVEAGARPPEMRGYRPPTCLERWLLGWTDADARREAEERARAARESRAARHATLQRAAADRAAKAAARAAAAAAAAAGNNPQNV